MSTVNPPRGMRDFLPADKRRREALLATIRAVYTRHGFDEIETPAVEESARLFAGIGGDNEKLAYAILRRGLSVADVHQADAVSELVDLGLRYDLTVPLARFYASNRARLPAVFRSIQLGPVWRAERPQKGRYRQFMQCDIDILGEPSTLAEIELIRATCDALAAIGLAGAGVRINDRRILTRLLDYWGVTSGQQRALITLDKLDKIGIDGVVAELSAHVPVDADRVRQTLASFADLGDGWSLQSPEWLDVCVYQDLRELRQVLGDLPIRFAPDLVRGMGYYTGTVFEVEHPQVSYSLGGGGRYDGMIGRFLGADVPAAGFSLGFERLVDLVTATGPTELPSVLLLFGDDAAVDIVQAKQLLVTAGYRVRPERRAKKMRTQLDRAGADGFTHFVECDQVISAHQQTGELAATLRPLG